MPVTSETTNGAGAARSSALQKLRQLQPGIQVQFDPRRGSPRFVANPQGFLTGPGGRAHLTYSLHS